MLRVNETRLLVQHESGGCKCRLNKSVFNANQTGRKKKKKQDEFWCECKKLDDWSSCKNDYMWNSSTYDCECNKSCKIDKYLDTKTCSCEKRLFGKLVSACEDEKLSTTETSLDDKKVTCEKNNCLIHTISLLIVCLILTVANSISCYYHPRDWIKRNMYCHVNIK